MPSLLVMAGWMGLLLGLRLRVPAVLAASAATVVAWTILIPLAKLPTLTAVMVGVALLSALQFGYMVGLMLSCARSRDGPWLGLLFFR